MWWGRGRLLITRRGWPKPVRWFFRALTSLLLLLLLLLILIITLRFRFLILIHRFFYFFQIGAQGYFTRSIVLLRGRGHRRRTHHGPRHHLHLASLQDLLCLRGKYHLVLRKSGVWQWPLPSTEPIVRRLEWHVQLLNFVHFLIILILFDKLVTSLRWAHRVVLEVLLRKQAHAASL